MAETFTWNTPPTSDTGVLGQGALSFKFDSIRFFPSHFTRYVAHAVQPVLRFVPGPDGHGEIHVRTISIRLRQIGRRPK